ncbi:unnamed protein product, partial [Adineta ricciae]
FSSSSSSAEWQSSDVQNRRATRKRQHRDGSSRMELSFSSDDYDERQSIFLSEASQEEKFEHNVTTALRIDHFLRKYCHVPSEMTTLVKLTLLHRMGLYEEQLYELCMYLRNDKENVVKHIIEQNNNQDTINGKTLNADEIVDSIVKALQRYLSIQLATPMIAVATIRRNSCTRQSLAPIRRSSLNVQFLMESRTRRLCQSRPSVMLDCKV